MRFWLVQTFVRKLVLQQPDEPPAEDGLRIRTVFDDTGKREFVVAFELVANLGHHGCLRLEYLARFNTDEDMSDEFKASHLPRANAPAVAYPYVRAFVSQFAVLSGFEAHTLPIRSFSPDTRPPPILPAPDPAPKLE
jgi:preprotein translocase subunit SecB